MNNCIVYRLLFCVFQKNDQKNHPNSMNPIIDHMIDKGGVWHTFLQNPSSFDFIIFVNGQN